MLGLNLALGVASPGQRSLLQRAISAIRRNNGTLIGIPDNFAGTYIDSAGTMPVTAVGDVLGLLTDRSYGAGNLGAELVTVPSISLSASSLGIGPALVAGKAYQVGFTVSNYTGTGDCGFDATTFTAMSGATRLSGNGTARGVVVAAGGPNIGLFTRTTNSATFSNISVREVLGNHATQPTTASKPTVTLLPKRTKGPVNQLLYSQWGGGGTAPTGWAAWAAGGVEGALLPSGMRQRVFTSAASQDFIYQTIALAANTTYTVAVAVDANPGNFVNGALVAYPTIPAGTVNSIASSGSVAAPGSIILATVTTAATAGNMLLRVGAGAQGATTGSVTLSAPAVFVGTVTAQQILDNGGIPLTTTQPLPNVLEWTNAISFDGTNDFLQTGITTGNEGWVCAGVTPGANAIGHHIFGNGATAATDVGVWFRIPSSNNAATMLVSNGTTREIVSPTSGAFTGTTVVVDGGWAASTVMAAVNGVEESTAKTVNCTTTKPCSFGGSVVGWYLNGPMTATVYTPVLPSAADRALIRKWIGSLQGQTL